MCVGGVPREGACHEVRRVTGWGVSRRAGPGLFGCPDGTPGRDGQPQPAGDEAAAADGGKDAQWPGAGQHQQVEAAAEQQDAEGEQAAADGDGVGRKAAGQGTEGDKGQGVVHLIAHGSLVDEQQGLGQHGTQAMGTEGAGGDSQGCEQGAGAQPGQADGGGWISGHRSKRLR